MSPVSCSVRGQVRKIKQGSQGSFFFNRLIGNDILILTNYTFLQKTV
jgi:hypothetical protein